MQDNRFDILSALVEVLKPIGLQVYSYVPNDMTKPYIYIGDIFFEELPNKDAFRLLGYVTIELITGSNEWLGSLKQPMEWYNDIKMAIKPRKTTVLIENMVYLRLDLDSGVQQFSESQRVYSATLQYEFQIQQAETWADNVDAYINRVINYGGIVEASECLYNFKI